MQNQSMHLVLSSDAKPRLKWTPELHQRFLDAVNQLGGPEKATPKSLMRVMGIPGLTLYHLKSHLQKLRLGKSPQPETSYDDKQEDYREDQSSDGHCSRETTVGTKNQMTETQQIAQALQLQMEVQRKLYEQIEVQRHLQLRIEAQGKYLQSVLLKAQEALAGYNPSAAGIEHAKAELSQLVSIINNRGPSSPISELTETGVLSLKEGRERKQSRGTMCSLESSLTSSESSGTKEEEEEPLKSNRTSVELELMTVHPEDNKELNGESKKQACGRKRSRTTDSDGCCVEQPISKRCSNWSRKHESPELLDLNSKMKITCYRLSHCTNLPTFSLYVYMIHLKFKGTRMKSNQTNMEISQVHQAHKLLTILLISLANLAFPFPFEFQPGSRQWHMTSDVREVAGKYYDYIVVGGGTAGCPLAATLSEKFSVLLVERGSSPFENPLVVEKRYYGFPLLNTDEYTSVAQSFTSEDGVSNVRGRVLGGSSAINGGIYSRASEEYVGKAGWDKKQVKEAYEWVESKVVFPPMFLSPWQSVAEFSLLEAGILPYNGYSLEHIKGTKISGSVFDGFGRRHTSADLLQAANPKTLTVLLNATVKSIIFSHNGKKNETRARGIKFMQSHGSPEETHEAYINKSKNSSSWGDVILAAGALGSPQLLLLSGIGPSQQLRKFNIPPVLDVPGVGQGIQDNPCIAILVDTKPGKWLPDPPLVAGIADGMKVIVETTIQPLTANSTRVNVAAKIASPYSRGKLELKSKDPRQNPAVKFNYLASEKDVEECVKMTKLLYRIARSKSIAVFFGTGSQKKVTSSTEYDLRKLCRKNVRTFYHYHGGCRVGSVVDRHYRVYGVEGLRIIDGSTFSESPGTNPMATLLMLGRYQGNLILKEGESVSDLKSK